MVKSSRRHESLIPLSREHHYGLMLCLRIRQGLSLHSDDEVWVRAKAADTVRFFESDLTPHFKAEEEALFPSMRGFVGASDLLDDLLEEHRELERLVARLAGSETSELVAVLNEFADLLERHIRKEERQLFPLYEEQTRSEQASEVQRAIKHVIGDALKPKNLELLR